MITVTGLSSPPKIIRAISVVRRADAYVIDKSRDWSPAPSEVSQSPERLGAQPAGEARRVPAPVSVGPVRSGGSSDDSGGSSSSVSGQPTPMTDAGIALPLLCYLDGAQTPSPTTPSSAAFPQLPSSKEIHQIECDAEDLDSPLVSISSGGSLSPRPTIIFNWSRKTTKGALISQPDLAVYRPFLPSSVTEVGYLPLSHHLKNLLTMLWTRGIFTLI